MHILKQLQGLCCRHQCQSHHWQESPVPVEWQWMDCSRVRAAYVVESWYFKRLWEKQIIGFNYQEVEKARSKIIMVFDWWRDVKPGLDNQEFKKLRIWETGILLLLQCIFNFESCCCMTSMGSRHYRGYLDVKIYDHSDHMVHQRNCSSLFF